MERKEMMNGPYLTIPADFDKERLLEYARLNDEGEFRYPVREVYGALKCSPFGSGRHAGSLPDCSEMNFREYVACGAQHGIELNYTFNANCLSGRELTPSGQKDLEKWIRFLVDCGVRKMTVALPPLLDFIHARFPGIQLYLSVVSGVDSLAKMKWLADAHVLTGVYLHERLYRDMPSLRIITDYCNSRDLEVGVLVNSLCDVNCPYRCYHYNLVAHGSEGGEQPFLWYYGTECNLRRIRDPRNVLNLPWIRPDDMDMYAELGITKFKVVGRDLVRFHADFTRVIQAYNQGHYEGDLFQLFMCFARVERADLFSLVNDKRLSDYLHRVFDGSLHCLSCDDCGFCKPVAAAILHDGAVADRYEKIYRERKKLGMSMGYGESGV